MRFMNAVLALLPKMYLVEVQFANTAKTYTYLSRFKVEQNDCVVVDSPTTGMTCVRVISCEQRMLDFEAEYQYKMIIAKVDVSAHNKFVEQVTELAEALHQKQQEDKLKELKRSMGIKKGDKLSKMLDNFVCD